MDNFDTERLIIEIQSRPSLWDSSAAEYSNRDIKKRNWEELVKIFGGGILSTIEKKELGHELQKRWKNIRGCYVREVKRQKHIKLGFSTGSRKTEYVYYKQLQFLRKVVTIKDADIQEDSTEDSRNEEETTIQEIQNKAERRSLKTKRFKIEPQNIPDENESDPLMEVLTKSIVKRKQRENSEDDEDRMFLLSLLTSLKSVPLEKKMTLKINIMSLINDAMQVNPLECSASLPNPHWCGPTQSGASCPVDPRSGYLTQAGPSSGQMNNSENTSFTCIPKIESPESHSTDNTSDTCSYVELSD